MCSSIGITKIIFHLYIFNIYVFLLGRSKFVRLYVADISFCTPTILLIT